MKNANLSGIGVLLGAGVLGVVLGVGTTDAGRVTTVAKAKQLGVAAGVARRRPPQIGDAWGGCNDARAAGTAPIYSGEPGYREDMDGDEDGIACEAPRT